MMTTATAKAKAKPKMPSRIPQTTTTTTAQRSQSIPVTTTAQRSQPIPVTSPDLRPFFSRLFSSILHSYSQRRPWFELVDRSTFSRPETLSEAASRIRKNFSYFRVNYTAIIVVIIAFSLMSHPFHLFFLMSILSAWIFLYLFRPADQPVFLLDRTFSDREMLGILIVSTILIVFLTGLVSLMIYSLLFGLGVACVHGAFRVPQDVFADDQETAAYTGFLSFLSATATYAAVATAPPPTTRV